MRELAVFSTDLLLGAENAALALILQRDGPVTPLRRAFSAFFIALAVAAVAGAAYHAWVFRRTVLDRYVWRLTLFAVIAAATMAWIAAGHLLRRRWLYFAGLLTFIVGLFVIFTNIRGLANGFGVAIVLYLPASAALLVAFAIVRAWVGVAGLVLSSIASQVQQSSLALGPLDHNTLYHLIEAIALLLIFLAARRCAGTRRTR